MSLRTRLIAYVNGVLVLTVALVVTVAVVTGRGGLRERAKEDALDTASLLANAAEMAVPPQSPVEEPAGGWPSPDARTVALAARKLAERDAWRGAVRRLIEKHPKAGNFEAIFVAEEHVQLLAWSSPSGERDLVDQYWHGVDLVANQASSTRKRTAQFQDDSVVAAVPLARDQDSPWVFVCKFDTRRLREATAASLHHIGFLSLIGLLTGALVSSVLARQISGPIGRLAEAARVVGAGGFNHRVKVVSKDELGVLAEAFNRMAASLQTSTAQLADAAAEKRASRRDLEIAAEIQRSLLPQSCPRLPNIDVGAVSVPARDVGGDFYDFIPFPDGRCGIVVADASGKGVPAALLMAVSRSLIRAYALDEPSVLQTLQRTNKFLLQEMHSDNFVTCFYGVIDPLYGTLTYVSAGHDPAILVRQNGESVLLRASTTPLGVEDSADMAEETCHLAPGDALVVYTDGILDAAEAGGERFGVWRLREIIQNLREMPSEEICKRVLTAVKTFAGRQPQFDDMTFVVMRLAATPARTAPEPANQPAAGDGGRPQ